MEQKQLENFKLFPFGTDVIYASDNSGENLYFTIICSFEYDDHTYVTYQYTTTPEYLHIAEVVDESESEHGGFVFSSQPLRDDDDMFETVRDLFNTYMDDNELWLEEEEEDD